MLYDASKDTGNIEGKSEETMITNASEFEEFLYCRRQWYYHKQGIHIDTEELRQGRLYHRKAQNIPLRSNIINGILDMIEGNAIVELKKTRSFKLYNSHKMQMMAYLYIAQHNGFNIKRGIVRYSNGKEFVMMYNKSQKRYLRKLIDEMQSIKKVPERTETKSKCVKCSLREYCYM